MRCTSRPGSRIWQEWMTGFGTASRSLLPPPSGAAIPSTARRMAPLGLRMSRRSVTVLSTGPTFMDDQFRPM